MSTKKPQPARLKTEAAARRRASIEQHGGAGVWRPRATRFRDRKKEASRKACRGKTKDDAS